MDAIHLHPAAEALIAILLVVGSTFCLVGAVGLVRFRDFFQRLHAPTKASTLGVGGMLLASMLWHWSLDQWAMRELLITLFLFVTAPVSANMLAQAALHLRVASEPPPPADVDRQ